MEAPSQPDTLLTDAVRRHNNGLDGDKKCKNVDVLELGMEDVIRAPTTTATKLSPYGN